MPLGATAIPSVIQDSGGGVVYRAPAGIDVVSDADLPTTSPIRFGDELANASPVASPSPAPTPDPAVQVCHDYLLKRAGLLDKARQFLGKKPGQSFSASDVTSVFNHYGWTPGSETDFGPGCAVQFGNDHCGFGDADGTVSHYTQGAPALGISAGTHNQSLQDVKNLQRDLPNGTQRIINTPYKNLPVKVWIPPSSPVSSPAPSTGPTVPTTPTTPTP
jgi:hypothetical protein